MKINKYTWFSIILTLVLVGLLGVLLINGTFSKGGATVPAQPWETTLAIIFLAVLGVWILSGALGWIMLSRKGLFAQLSEKMVGAEWGCAIIGILLLAGLWMVAVLPGPFLMWIASMRPAPLLCPKCKKWMPRSAVRCAHCGTTLPGAPVEAPAAPQPPAKNLVTPVAAQAVESKVVLPATAQTAETKVVLPAQVQCENCKEVNPAGAIYPIYYGTLAGAEYLGNQRTRYSFKIAGSKQIFLCNKCVVEYGKKRMKQIGLGVPLGMVVIVIGIFICSLLMKATNPGGANQVSMGPAIVMILILSPLIYFWMRRQAVKNPLGQGDLLARKLCQAALKSLGYTRFYTRQQMHDNQLL